MPAYRTIVIYGNAGWSEHGGGSSSQQIGMAFLQLGYRLLFINPNAQRPVRLQEFPGTFLNVVGSAGSVDSIRQVLREWGATRGDTLFICSMATANAPDLLKFFSAERFPIVYRCVDWFTEAIAEHTFDAGAAAAACKVATLITVSHPELRASLPSSAGEQAITMTNGVNLDLFQSNGTAPAKPRDLVSGAVTIGFWGTFWGHRIDWPLVRALAETKPNWSVNFIAYLQYLDIDQASMPANVHFLGWRRKDELPAYVKHFDLCLIPYRQDLPFARYSNPIKALESLAALKPVVTPANTSLARYPGVFFYESVVEARDAIARAVSDALDADAVLDFVAQNTWARKAEDLIREVSARSR